MLNANGAPQFAENHPGGQPLRISLLAMDPDNPEFEPRFWLSEGGALSGAGVALLE